MGEQDTNGQSGQAISVYQSCCHLRQTGLTTQSYTAFGSAPCFSKSSMADNSTFWLKASPRIRRADRPKPARRLVRLWPRPHFPCATRWINLEKDRRHVRQWNFWNYDARLHQSENTGCPYLMHCASLYVRPHTETVLKKSGRLGNEGGINLARASQHLTSMGTPHLGNCLVNCVCLFLKAECVVVGLATECHSHTRNAVGPPPGRAWLRGGHDIFRAAETESLQHANAGKRLTQRLASNHVAEHCRARIRHSLLGGE